MAAPATNDEIVFLNGRPTFEEADEVRMCFRGQRNGLLFRLVSHSSNTWAFYNDTKEFAMKIQYDFGEDSHDIKPLGTTTMIRNSQACTCKLVVGPLQTALFIQGRPTRILNADFEKPPPSPYHLTRDRTAWDELGEEGGVNDPCTASLLVFSSSLSFSLSLSFLSHMIVIISTLLFGS
eukprot:gene8966-6289_t